MISKVMNTIGDDVERESGETARLSCYMDSVFNRYQSIVFELNGKVNRVEFYVIANERTIKHKHTVTHACDEQKILQRLRTIYK